MTSNHILQRTSPIGATFRGRCIFCGEEKLSITAFGQPCPKAPDDKQTATEAIKGMRR